MASARGVRSVGRASRRRKSAVWVVRATRKGDWRGAKEVGD
jgi:hypothetical protein